jgi:transmembrane sensor
MNQQLLAKFFKGECSVEEQSKIMHWYLSGEADQELSDKIEAYWKEKSTKKDDHWGREALFGTINEQLYPAAQEEKIIPIQRRSDQPLHGRFWNYAAVLALLMLSAAWGYYHFFYEPILALNQDDVESQPQDSIIIKQTARGEKLTLILEDSTVVKLNSESQLRYTTASVREVYLEGEAFFEVARDTLHPFQIHTGQITTTVLGTSFNIKAFTGEKEVAVSVVSGEVKVARMKARLEAQQDKVHEQSVHLIPGEQVICKHAVFTKKEFDAQEILSWKEGRLYFKDASFSEVISRLERWYGVEIEVQRKGIEDGFSGSYTNRSLESVLEGMSFVLNFEYEILDKKIIIK